MKCKPCREPMLELREREDGPVVGAECPECHAKVTWRDPGYIPIDDPTAAAHVARVHDGSLHVGSRRTPAERDHLAALAREAKAKTFKPRVCKWAPCSGVFLPTQGNQKYCSNPCRAAVELERAQTKRATEQQRSSHAGAFQPSNQ